MNTECFIHTYWRHVAEQNRDELYGCFQPDAIIRWHCTNEQFTVDEFISANCEYPGEWQAEVERLDNHGSVVTTVARVWSKDLSFHVCSFIQMKNGRISSLDEYWGDDGIAPEWRRSMRLGRPIKA